MNTVEYIYHAGQYISEVRDTITQNGRWTGHLTEIVIYSLHVPGEQRMNINLRDGLFKRQYNGYNVLKYKHRH